MERIRDRFYISRRKPKQMAVCKRSLGARLRGLTGAGPKTGGPMLSYALLFLIVALIAGALGFFAVAGVAATIAKVLFFVFLILFVVSLVTRGRSGPPAV